MATRLGSIKRNVKVKGRLVKVTNRICGAGIWEGANFGGRIEFAYQWSWREMGPKHAPVLGIGWWPMEGASLIFPRLPANDLITSLSSLTFSHEIQYCLISRWVRKACASRKCPAPE